MKELATATVASIAMTTFGVPTVLILSGLDRRWLAVVGILALSPFLIVFYNRLQELQVRGKTRMHLAQAARYEAGPVVDVTPRLQVAKELLSAPPSWSGDKPGVSDRDLAAFVSKMFLEGTWSKRAAKRWLLPDSKWVSHGTWQAIMDHLEMAGVLGPATSGVTRQLLVGSEREALEQLGIAPADRWTGGGPVDVNRRNLTVRWVGEGEG